MGSSPFSFIWMPSDPQFELIKSPVSKIFTASLRLVWGSPTDLPLDFDFHPFPDKVDPDCWRMFETLLHLGEDSPRHLYGLHPSVHRFSHLFSRLAWSKGHPHSSCSLSLLSPFAASGRLPADAAPLAAPCKWADKGKRKEREKKSKQYICIHLCSTFVNIR